MSGSEYRAMWLEYIKHFSYKDAREHLQQGYLCAKSAFPDGLGRVMIEVMRAVALIELQWCRLLHRGFNR